MLSALSPRTNRVPPLTKTSTLPASMARGSRLSIKNLRRLKIRRDTDVFRAMTKSNKGLLEATERRRALFLGRKHAPETLGPMERDGSKINRLGSICQLGKHFLMDKRQRITQVRAVGWSAEGSILLKFFGRGLP